jgi:hypothetical protein
MRAVRDELVNDHPLVIWCGAMVAMMTACCRSSR